MELVVKSRNGKVSDRQRALIEEKIGRLERYLDAATSATVEIASEKQRNGKAELHRLQVTLVGEHGIIVRADQTADDLYKAVDLVQGVLQRQIKRYKEKHWRRGRLRRQGGEFVPSEPAVETPGVVAGADAEGAESTPTIVRVKEFDLKPMFSDEAVEQMELLDHSFFVFRDADTSLVSVVYRRKDGNYGLIVPGQ